MPFLYVVVEARPARDAIEEENGLFLEEKNEIVFSWN